MSQHECKGERVETATPPAKMKIIIRRLDKIETTTDSNSTGN
ncbi:hypothetical protein ACFHYQ_23975 [Sphaerimonospora cavernae]|uniref:Uncharacterized protein n=1 Tax=Sphaerimonospora cavernae TaxID=1740611 RepID=A0ABV6UAX5_9ACTN